MLVELYNAQMPPRGCQKEKRQCGGHGLIEARNKKNKQYKYWQRDDDTTSHLCAQPVVMTLKVELRDAESINNQFITLPDATSNPETAVNNFGISAICGFDSAKHAKAILAGVDFLGALGAKQRIKDVAWSRQRTASSHLENGWNLVGGLEYKGALDDADGSISPGLSEVISASQDSAVSERSGP